MDCFWKHHFVGGVCYVDDVALLAPSRSALKNMLSTCINLLIVIIMIDGQRAEERKAPTQMINFFTFKRSRVDLGMLYVNMRL